MCCILHVSIVYSLSTEHSYENVEKVIGWKMCDSTSFFCVFQQKNRMHAHTVDFTKESHGRMRKPFFALLIRFLWSYQTRSRNIHFTSKRVHCALQTSIGTFFFFRISEIAHVYWVSLYDCCFFFYLYGLMVRSLSLCASCIDSLWK